MTPRPDAGELVERLRAINAICREHQLYFPSVDVAADRIAHLQKREAEAKEIMRDYTSLEWLPATEEDLQTMVNRARKFLEDK